MGQARRRPRQGRPQVLSDRDYANADGPYFFFRLFDIKSPVAALQLGEYPFPLEGLTAAEFGVHGDVRQDLHFSASARTLGANVRADGVLVDAYSEHPGVRLHLDVVNGRGPLALLPAPLSTWLSGNPRGRSTSAGPFSHPVIDGEVHEIDANLEGISSPTATPSCTSKRASSSLHPAAGKVARGRPRPTPDFDLSADGRAAGTAVVALKGVDPGEIPKLPRAAAAELAGRLDGKVHLAGNLVRRREHIELSHLSAPSSRATSPAAACRARSSSPATASTRPPLITLQAA